MMMMMMMVMVMMMMMMMMAVAILTLATRMIATGFWKSCCGGSGAIIITITTVRVVGDNLRMIANLVLSLFTAPSA